MSETLLLPRLTTHPCAHGIHDFRQLEVELIHRLRFLKDPRLIEAVEALCTR